MANYTREQFEKEVQFSKLILKNVIIHNKDAKMVANARTILATPVLFERFVINRLNKKYPKVVEKTFSLSSLMFWKK
ncbi:MAG: hypothetical protein M0R77_02650 [Gammaproteobacteria bacterium]|nr:hypothetical protein [Gammaproteobacteria bacterium]